ncbi:MAG: hypothetical protein CL610_24635 [Anaerolineaceae bacterium]|nr:hypothetical protein [Anaerolineaceae bacterium]
MTDESKISKSELLQKMQTGWSALQTYIRSLTEAQMTGPTDAAGWTVKDHLIHLAIWEDSMNALQAKQSRRASMGLDDETWNSRDFDRMNAVIQQNHKDMPLADVLQRHADVHQRLSDTIEALPEEDLYKPYSHYQPDSPQDRPVIGWLVGDTYEHYAEHMPWMDAIVK